VFERFTGAARDVIVLAQEAAREFRYDWIGTEHLLLGMTRVGGPHCNALNESGLTEAAARAALDEQPNSGDAAGQMPFTPEAKDALERALRQALALHHRHIGPSHLGLALIEGPGLASEIIASTVEDASELRRSLAACARAEVHTTDATPLEVAASGDDGDVLLALYDQEETITARVLRDLGIERTQLAEAVRRAR
jgi:ATP-dependent Clp protease ATP-binding subunit ClpA